MKVNWMLQKISWFQMPEKVARKKRSNHRHLIVMGFFQAFCNHERAVKLNSSIFPMILKMQDKISRILQSLGN